MVCIVESGNGCKRTTSNRYILFLCFPLKLDQKNNFNRFSIPTSEIEERIFYDNL